MNLNAYLECARRCVCLKVAPASLPHVLSIFHQTSSELERAYYWQNGGGLLLLQSRSNEALRKALKRIRHYPRAYLPIKGPSYQLDRFPLPPYRVCSDPSVWPASGVPTQFDDIVQIQPSPPSPKSLKKLLLKQESVAGQMQALVNATALTHPSRLARFTFADSLLEVLNAVRPGSSVYPFGSAINGLGTNSSDLDIILELGLGMPPKLRKFADLYPKEVVNFHQNPSTKGLAITQELCGYTGQANYRTLTPVRMLLNRLDPLSAAGSRVLPGRTPIINYARHKCIDLGVDISWSSASDDTTRLVLHAAYWMRSLVTQVPVFPFLAAALKYLMRGAHVTHHGPAFGYTNYKLTALLVAFLQAGVRQAPALEYLLLDESTSIPKNFFIPNEERSTCPSDAPELLREFFTFLRSLNPQKTTICLRSGRILPRENNSLSGEQFLYCPNPLLPERNITHGIDASLWDDLLAVTDRMEGALGETRSAADWGLPAMAKSGLTSSQSVPVMHSQ